MTRFPFAALLVLALALPATGARAQTEVLLDDAQRATIQDYFKKEAEKAAAAEQARKAQQAKTTDKGAAKGQAKGKKTDKAKPKAARKDKTQKAKGKDKAKNAKSARNGRNGDKPKPPPVPKLEPGQVLAQDLPRRALPKALDSQLGKPARGTQRVIVGDDIVVFERKTGRILDVVADVVKSSPGR